MWERVKLLRVLVGFIAISSVITFLFIRRGSLSYKSKLDSQQDQITFKTPEELGEALFFDPRLSSDNSTSCASCHQPELAFSDGKSKSVGVGGRLSFRNAPSLLNVKDAKTLMFDAHITSLEEQAIVPIQDSNEMNLSMKKLIEKLQKVPEYQKSAKELYARDFDPWVLTRSLAAFERTLTSEGSKFDVYQKTKDPKTLGAGAYQGWKLFQEFQCIECHSLPHFSDYQAHNNGLTAYFGSDFGKFRIAGDSNEMGSFRTPSLRNVAITAPYLHDGSVNSINEILDRYSRGGYGHENQDVRIRSRNFSKEEKQFLISFLHSLTDSRYLVNED